MDPDKMDPEKDSKNGDAFLKEQTAEPAAPSRIATIRAFLFKHMLPISLIIGITIGISWPTPGVTIGTKSGGVRPVQYACVIAIFLVSGLKLKTQDVKVALQERKAVAWALFSILFVTVVVGIKLTTSVTFPDIPVFQTGLSIFWSAPTTISSGVVLVQQANGDAVLALMLTVTTNVIAVFTIPGMLEWLADFAASVSLDIGSLILKLVYTVFIPLMVGKLLRRSKHVCDWVDSHKLFLKLISVYGIVLIPWMTVSRASDDGNFDDVTARSILALVGWGAMMHIIFLLINFTATAMMKLSPKAQRAVVVVASQKTLPVALTVLTFLPESAGDEGLMSVACVVAHLTQIIIDSILVSKWAVEEPPRDEEESVDLEDYFDPTAAVVKSSAANDNVAVDLNGKGALSDSDGISPNGASAERKESTTPLWQVDV